MESDVNIKEGYKWTAVGVIPDEWEVKRLKEIGNFYRGKGIPKSDVIENGLKAIRYGEIYTIHHYYIKEFQSFISKNTAETSFLIKKNDVLFTSSGETLEDIGKSVAYLGDEEAYAGGDTIILRPLKNKFDSKFLGFATNSDAFRVQTYRMGQGHSVVHIYPSNLKKTKLPIPPLPEQKTIANCLTTWDSGIEKLSALIKAKKEQKKGLMQQLLSGEKRLDGFEGEWKEVKLGKLGETFNGLTGKSKKDFGEGKPYVTYLNTFRQNKIDKSTCFDFVNVGENENQSILEYGDLIFTTSSETPNEVGMSSVILFHPIDNLYLNSFCFGLRLNSFEQLNPNFAVFLLRGADFRREMYKLAQGSTRFNLSKSSFKMIVVKLPPIKEQAAIANVLTTADKEIALLEKKLERFKEQKRGLMQVLLTGERRLIN